jgi:hypothetical protein
MSLNPITALSKQLEKLINEHGSAAILRERLALFVDKISQLEKENADLKTELHKTHEECIRLRSQIKNQSVANEFVEHEGFLFKIKPTGGYHSAVYCPSCKMVMGTIAAGIPLSCEKCQLIAPWSLHDIPRILKELTSESNPFPGRF